MRAALVSIAFAFALTASLPSAHAIKVAPDQADPSSQKAIERVSENGPIKATVRVEPSEPLLGDPVTLTLTVETAAGVTVEMPAFGEALGRFAIVGFTPRQERTAAGGMIASQTYVLDPPMSGRQRIPPLRIEYLDERPGQQVSGLRELLTEEIALNVQSVVTDSELSSELRSRRADLSAVTRPRSFGDWLPWIALGMAALVGLVALILWRRARFQVEVVDPYELADRQLRQLEATGLPTRERVDNWYVELSAIVRHYIENRYHIRAPELTTEEFLRAAQHSTALSGEHRETLLSFLAQCDRVKFAGHRPEQDEAEQALHTARKFLDDTRAADDSQTLDKRDDDEDQEDQENQEEATAAARIA